MVRCLWTLLAVLAGVAAEYLMGGHLDNNARIKSRIGNIKSSSVLERKTHVDDLDLDLVAEESTVGAVAVATMSSTSTDNDVPRYHIPYPFAFNGGKPFSLEKDPITGKIDFEKAPPVKALNYTDGYHENNESENDSKKTGDEEDTSIERERIKGNDNDDVGPNEININTANFHDFLNLPMHYSSDKYGDDKYPLISSSYANTKVQSGANSYSTYNHRPYHENNLYAQSVKNPYSSLMRTSTHRTTTINDLKTKWTIATKPTTITTSTPSTTIYSSKIALSTTTKTPVVTTWKPSTTPLALHSFNRTVTEENEKSTLSIEKLSAFSNMDIHKNPSNVPTQSTKDEKTIDKAQTAIHYKDQPNLTNFVLSHHTGTDVKPSAPNEEYKDSYDIYESPDGEGEDEGDSHRDGNSEESDYFLPFRESQKNVTSISSATISNATTSTTTTISMVTTSSLSTSTTTTVVPSVTTSTLFTPQEPINSLKFPTMMQHPAVSSSLSNDRKPSITERYDGIISQEYKPTIKSESDRVGPGTVIESTSNIIVPPDQDTVSFVLGNHQSVEGGYYSIGTAIGENPYGSSSDSKTSSWPIRNNPHGPMKDIKYDYPLVFAAEPDSDHVTQKWWPSGSSALKNSEPKPTKSQNPFATVPITTVNDTKNRTKEENSGYITFPNDEMKNKDALTEEHVIIINEADGSIRELPPKTSLTAAKIMTITTNKTKNNVSDNVSGDLPQLAENLMPPAESSRLPPYYYHYQYDTLRTDHPRPQRLPLPSRTKPYLGISVPPPLDAGLRRRPYSPDTKLPNILPQFRPNAKASHGHRFGSDVIGTMPAGQGLPTRVRQPLQNHPSRRPYPPPPSYLQRLNPPPPPINAVKLAFVPTSKVDGVALPHETESTIRRFRLPHASSHGVENAPSNRLFDAAQDESDNKKRDRNRSDITIEHENENSERYPEEPPMTPPKPPMFPRHRTADPPRVTTLQMIQHHGEFNENEGQLTQPVEPVLVNQAERRKSDNYDSETAEQPVYVVYPVNTAINIHPDDSKEKDDDGGVVVGTRGPHRPLPPDTLLQDEQEKVHTVYDGNKPVSLDFPYPLEHPDSSIFSATDTKETPLLVPSEHRQQTSFANANKRENAKNEQDAVNVIPYLQDFLPYQKKADAAISVTLHRTGSTSASATTSTLNSTTTSTSTPIAYVYTPTRAAAHSNHHLDYDDMDVSSNIDATATVLLPSQQPSSSSSSAPAPQNFMAPFVASMSAEAPNKNGWSVVVVEQPSGANKRIDDESDDAKHISSEADTQTEKMEFDVDNFKPQLFSGFKPIYEFPTEDTEERRDANDTNIETNMPKRSKELSVPDKG